MSDAYLDETVALVVRDHLRDQFGSWAQIRGRRPLTIAVPDLPYYVRKIDELLPQATLTVQADVAAWFATGGAGSDALAFPAERGSAWTLRFPAFSVVVPGPDPIKVPLAYPIGRSDAALARVVNTWISLKRKDGTFDAAYRHWILGQDATPHRPRWSIIRDVLHWVE
jgi:hypothetical protein